MSSPGSSVLEQRAALIRWPDDDGRRAGLAAQGVPCLLVIEPGAALPLLAAGEDWIYRTADERDVAARLERLTRAPRRPAADAPIVVPSHLSPTEHRAAVQLASSLGRFVPAEDLEADVLTDAELDVLVSSLRAALEPVGFRLTAIGRDGLLLERDGPASP